MAETGEQFSLRWKNFHNNMQLGLEDLLEAKELIDVTLACEGRSLHAHRNILAVCSPYFRTLFKNNPCKHPIIFMQDVRLSDMQAILQFIYRGETDIGEQDLPQFLKTAEALQVRGLAGSNKVDEREQQTTIKSEDNCLPTPAKKRKQQEQEQRGPPGSPTPSSLSLFDQVEVDLKNDSSFQLLVDSEKCDVSSENETSGSPDGICGSGICAPVTTAGPSTTGESLNTPDLKKAEQRSEGFLCTTCNKFYTSRYNLKAHERNIHAKAAQPAFCDICQKVFKNDDALRTHTYYKHTGPDALSGQSHSCDVCGKKYKLRHDLVSHQKNAHGEFARPFTCDLCFKVCKNWHALQTHKSRNHKQDVQQVQ